MRVLAEQEQRRQPLETEAVDERPVAVDPGEPGVDVAAEDALGDRTVDGTHTTVRTSQSPNVVKIRSTTGMNRRRPRVDRGARST